MLNFEYLKPGGFRPVNEVLKKFRLAEYRESVALEKGRIFV
jgi:hypothetical protein